MLDTTEMAALLICATMPKVSVLGNALVIRYTVSAASEALSHTKSRRWLLTSEPCAGKRAEAIAIAPTGLSV